MQTIGIIHLLQIDLPGRSIRLCDGGFIYFGGHLFTSKDEIFGAIGSAGSLTEGLGEEIPALELVLLPPMTSAAAQLSAPGYQNSQVRLWAGEYNDSTGQLIGAPALIFHGQIDQMTSTIGRSRREVSLTIVSTAERLFSRNDGNGLSPRWHRQIWPGERGHDNATGLTVPVSWGVAGRPGASITPSFPKNTRDLLTGNY